MTAPAYPASTPAYFPNGVVVAPTYVAPIPRSPLERLVDRLRPRPSRATRAEARLARAWHINAGLRERLAELVDQRDELLDALTEATDETARELGHQHPAVTRVRAIVASVPR